jgi:Protein of unknown function (DUF3102)
MKEVVPEELAELASKIRSAHEACQAGIKSGLEYAIACGTHLNQAKVQLGHGNWQPWLKRECPQLSKRTAQLYMQLAANRTVIEAKSATIAHLTINAARDLIPPKEGKGPKAPAYAEAAPDASVRVEGPPAEVLEDKLERDLERETSRQTVPAPPCTELARYAYTRPFECTPSYDPDEEEAEEPIDDSPLEKLSGDLCAALIYASGIAHSVLLKGRGMQKGQHFRDEKLPALLAATIKNLQDLEQELRRWNSAV